jgi:hypothetical protein
VTNTTARQDGNRALPHSPGALSALCALFFAFAIFSSCSSSGSDASFCQRELWVLFEQSLVKMEEHLMRLESEGSP